MSIGGEPGAVEIDGDEYRKVLGHFPTGVTVVAATNEDGTASGLAIGSFFSISLDPPLVGFCVGRESQSWAAIRGSGHFVVNVLSAAQAEVCGQFASKADDKFAGVPWAPSAHNGSPRIDGCLAHIDCVLDGTLDGGDHEIVVGRVVGLDVTDESDAKPLLFFKGKYGQIQDLG